MVLVLVDRPERESRRSQRRMSLREGRLRGLTLRKLREYAQQLREADMEVTAESVMQLALADQSETMAAGEDPQAVDWDRLLAFIERLLALIMALFLDD